MLLELLAAMLLCESGDSSSGNSNVPKHRSAFNSFEEADSFFDQHGNEHVVDDDGYCDECDDCHED